MRWEELTSDAFRDAAAETGVCVVAMGVIEKHSDHLPLGTDYLNGHRIVCLAAEKEPAIVFPPFYFGQIYEARSFPGTVTIPPQLLLELMEEIFAEISRNGIKKILLCNAHGGNDGLIRFLLQAHLAEERDYALYAVNSIIGGAPASGPEGVWDANVEEDWGGHANEAETSISLANHPDMVKMERVPDEAARPLERTSHLEGISTGIDWYGSHPDQYSGDGRKGSAEKGAALRDLTVDAYAGYIRKVKEDEAVPGLLREFYGRCTH